MRPPTPQTLLARSVPAVPITAPPRRAVTFVVTLGSGSLDRYSQMLGSRLVVPKLYTTAYAATAQAFNARLLSRASVQGLRRDSAVAWRLRRETGLLHLPNHHMGRYAHALTNPYLITVHDLIRYFDARSPRQGEALIHPPNLRDRLLLGLDQRAIKRAEVVIAVSHSTKRDLVEHLGVAEDRVVVVYEGIDHSVFYPDPRRTVDGPYVLFVGSEHPRKNLVGLLEALATLTREPRFRGLKLVKVGRAGGPEAEFRRRTLAAVKRLGMETQVVFAGLVDDADLRAYYSGASCLALPSLAEGFGLPPLEAMACGCPVVVSDRGALAEVADGAAVLADPRSRASLEQALRVVLEDDGVARELRVRGLRRAREFTWERAARETTRIYDAM